MSVREFADNGEKYISIDVDQLLFDNADINYFPKIVARYITEKYRGTIIGNDSKRAYVDRNAANEYSRPARKNLEPDVYETKARAASELENLMEAAKLQRHEENQPGRHSENTGGWDVYSVIVYNPATKQYYSGEIHIEYVEKGKRFHDLTKMKNVTASMKDRNALRSRQSHPDNNLLPSTEINNSHSGQNQNSPFSLAEMDLAYEDAYNDYDNEEGERLVREAAEAAMPDSKIRDENGWLKVVYHQTNATDENGEPFTVFDLSRARTSMDIPGFFFAPEYDQYHEIWRQDLCGISRHQKTGL